jgi:hypothetical protein
MPQHTTGGAGRRSSPAPRSGTQQHDDPGDEVLAAVLIRMWALASGRTLRRDVPPDQLSAEELIDFWADDMNPQPGRHVRPGGPDSAADAQATAVPARPAPQRRSKAHRRPSSRGTARSCQERPADPAAA